MDLYILKKSAAKFLCVKTMSDKVVGNSVQYRIFLEIYLHLSEQWNSTVDD